MRGWTQIIALQVEYSLLERTVEGELAPLALDQGMALVPWSPLKNGFLTDMYRRDAAVVDIAAELDATPGAVTAAESANALRERIRAR